MSMAPPHPNMPPPPQNSQPGAYQQPPPVSGKWLMTFSYLPWIAYFDRFIKQFNVYSAGAHTQPNYTQPPQPQVQNNTGKLTNWINSLAFVLQYIFCCDCSAEFSTTVDADASTTACWTEYLFTAVSRAAARTLSTTWCCKLSNYACRLSTELSPGTKLPSIPATRTWPWLLSRLRSTATINLAMATHPDLGSNKQRSKKWM